MKVTFLGTAAWEAIPALFCQCPTCVHARVVGNHDIRKRTVVLLNDDLLIDCGPDLIASTQQYGVSLTRLETLLVTHSHDDHWHPSYLAMRLPDYCPSPPPPLSIYGPGPVTGPLRRDRRWPEIERHGQVKLNTVRAGQTWQTGTYQVTAVPANHAGKQAALLYIIDDGRSKLFYATDTGPLSEQAWRLLAREAPYDLVLMDETLGNHDWPQHHSLRTFLEDHDRFYQDGLMAENALFVAVHFSHQSNPPHQDLVEYFAPHDVVVAYDGMELEL
jgi:phosphoribosyl 1,2-cyclic phosphate phosphodiesterase